MSRIYLDHAAATPVDPGALEAMLPYFGERFANPSAVHAEGVSSRVAVEESRRAVSEALLSRPDEIAFTSGATESANLALRGAVSAWKKAHPTGEARVIVSSIEHDAVLETALALERSGADVVRLPVDPDGKVDLETLERSLTENTVLVAVMYANNEIGTIQPIAEISRIVRKWKKDHRGVIRSEPAKGDDRYPLLYTDASQAPNYLECRVDRHGVDLMTLSSGKIYGPKGIGLLYAKRGTPIDPMLVGGGQESGIRSGTENVPGIVGFAHALRLAGSLRESESSRLASLRDGFIAKVRASSPRARLNGHVQDRLPNNVNLSFPDVDHEYLVLALDAEGFAVATKSACNETEAETSHVLLALAESDPGRPTSGIRITLGRGTLAADLDRLASVLPNAVALASRPFSS